MRKPHRDLEQLRHLLSQRKAEGLRFKQLAARSGIPIHVLQHRSLIDSRATAQPSSAKNSKFVEVCPDPAPSASGVEILLPQGLRVRLEPAFDQETLSRLLSMVAC